MFSNRQLFVAFKVLIILTVCGFWAGTAIAYFGVQNAITTRVEDRMFQDTSSISRNLSRQMATYSDLLYDVRAYVLFDASARFGEKQWQDYIVLKDTFNRYRGIGAVALIKYIPNNDTEGATAQMRETFPGFDSIWPASETRDYAVVGLASYSEELQSSESGYNLFSDGMRKQTLEKAAERRQPEATPPVTLVSGDDGFIISLPIYEQDSTLWGFGNVAFKSEVFFEDAFKDVPSEFNIRVTDVTDEQEYPLYSRSLLSSPRDSIVREDILSVAHRKWRITYSVPESYYTEGVYRVVPLLILLGGTILSVTALVLGSILIRINKKLYDNNKRA